MGNITKEIFLASKKIRWIQCPGTGIDKIMSIPEKMIVMLLLQNRGDPY
ncbi:MAG: hypothetical protein CM1200mP3_02130 [Chloroflexota bacterium]|nr:MAG: hypothetical protein CM1200mP3_02130 [Chloroflexota bacterium]